MRQFWTTVVRKNKKGERRNNDSKRRYAGADQKDDACPFLHQPGAPYAFFLFYGRYDVPAKAEDKARLEDSEELYEYLIGTISPLAGEYEPGKAEFGFLYPAFRDRRSEKEYVNLFERIPERTHRELTQWLLKG